HETALLVRLDADVLQAEAFGVRAAADGDQDNVGIDGLLLAALGGFGGKSDDRSAGIALGDLGAGLELDALLAKDLLGLFGDLGVHARSTDLAQELNDSNLRAQTRPDRG